MRDIINPRQTIVVTCRGNAEVLGKSKLIDSGLAVAWHTPLSLEPELYGISLSKRRFSYRIIKDTKVFAVNFMLFEHKDDVLLFGTTTGQTTDKFKESNLTKVDCDTIDCCRIKEAAGYLECEVIDEIETGDHVFIIGKVGKSRLDNEGKRLFHKGGNSFTSTV